MSRKRKFLAFEGVDWEAEGGLSGRRRRGHTAYCGRFRFEVTDVLRVQEPPHRPASYRVRLREKPLAHRKETVLPLHAGPLGSLDVVRAS